MKMLKEHAAGLSAAELCRQHGAEPTFYQIGAPAMAGGRPRRRARLLAETMLDASTLKEMLEKLLMPRLRSVL